MASVLLASFPGASSITTGGSWGRSKQSAKNYYASSYVTSLWHNTGKIQKEYCVMISSRHRLKDRYKVIEGGSTCQECERKYAVNAISGQSFEYEAQPQDPKRIWDSVKDGLNAFYRFSRPYSTNSALMGATSITFLAVEKLSDISLVYFIGWLQAMVLIFFMSIFICGLNQLCDVEIDKINKPYLPLASGEWSFRTGVIIVVSSLIMGLCFAWIIGSWPLFWTLFISSLIAAAYSVDLPLLRWKKSAILAMANNVANMGVVAPLGFFFHMQTYVLKRPATFPRQLIFCIAIFSLFSIVITLFKDLPDMEGDEKFGIQSLSLSLGQKRVFWICISLLKMTYGVAILAGATSPFLWSKISTALGHVILASILWYNAKSVDLKNNAALQSFYMFIWKLFCAEFFLLPLFR